MTSHFIRAALTASILLAVVACEQSTPPGGDTGQSGPGAASGQTSDDATEVTVAPLQQVDLNELVTAPGETVALVAQKLRAPYTGSVTRLHAVVGQRVERGEVLGTIVARDSEAALEGAQQMLADAQTAAEKADARRALELAQHNLISSPLEATARGVITAVSTAEGDRVSDNQEILTIVASQSVQFQASVSQSDLAKIHSGQRATVKLSGNEAPLSGHVKGLLGAADVGTLTAPLRIDLDQAPRWIAPGLFGTAEIEIQSRDQVIAAPRAAVLRDDLSGVQRLALVTPQHEVHWVEVTTGLVEGDTVEIRSPELAAGQVVIVSGQIGLPEGAPVRERP